MCNHTNANLIDNAHPDPMLFVVLVQVNPLLPDILSSFLQSLQPFLEESTSVFLISPVNSMCSGLLSDSGSIHGGESSMNSDQPVCVEKMFTNPVA